MGDHEDAGQPVLEGEVAVAPQRRARPRWRRPAIVVVLACFAVAGFAAWRQAAPIVASRKYRKVTYSVPRAPRLTPHTGETVYRIDPTKSSLTYALTERFVGRKPSTASGTTSGLAGDVALDPAHPDNVRVGQIVANLEQLHSNNNLRDARLRKDFLESHAFPLAHFSVDKITGLPATMVEGRSYPFTMTGKATIKQKTAPVTWQAKAGVKDGRITATATTHTKLSTFEVGPISLAGLVKTSDEVTLTLKLTAADPAQHVIPTRITGPDAKPVTGGPSFKAVVKPILERSCASCHNSGEIGADRWLLDTAADAASTSDGIKTVTETGYMPPSPASDKGVPLQHELKLAKGEAAQLAKWATAGGGLDVPRSTPIAPTAQLKALRPRKDAKLRIQTYTGVPAVRDDYRCFVLDPKLTKATYLTGYGFVGDQTKQIHHVQVFHVTKAQVANAPLVDGKDGRPGWGCYAGPGLRGNRGAQGPRVPGQRRVRPPTLDMNGKPKLPDAGFSGQADLVAGWVPGQTPSIYPDHSGILLQPGDALILQIHYNFANQIKPDTSGLDLQLDPKTPKIKPLRIVNPVGPVEIPCKPGATEPLCNRDASIADYVKTFGPSGSGNEAGLLGLCGKTPEQLTKGYDGTVASSTCDMVVPEDGRIVAVLGHMHTLGRTIRMTLDPGAPNERILLDIPLWRFGWQMNYELATPLHVKRGEPLRLDCSWDRSIDPKRPQRYIVFAEGTNDEMCFGTYALIPDNP